MLEDNKSYLNDLNDAQLSAVLKTDGPSMVIAGAGSGKTKVLISRSKTPVYKYLKNELTKTQLE